MVSNPPSGHDWVAARVPELFSIVVPARDEAKNLQVVVPKLVIELEGAGVSGASRRLARLNSLISGYMTPPTLAAFVEAVAGVQALYELDEAAHDRLTK